MKEQHIHLNTQLSTIIPTGLKTSIAETLPRAIQRIAQELHPEKIVLFGSFTYGYPTPDSDVDLLVIMETDVPPKERSWTVSHLLLPRPFPVDILVRTPAEIKTALAKGNFFIPRNRFLPNTTVA